MSVLDLLMKLAESMTKVFADVFTFAKNHVVSLSINNK